MKTNAIIRIIIWSLVLVLLVSILCSALLFRNIRRTSELPAETAIPTPLTEATILYEEDFPITCDTEATVTVYSAPSIDSSSVGQIDPGDTVTIGRQENVSGEAWAYITEPTAGWVMVKNLEIGGPVSEDLSPSSPSASGSISMDPRQIREIDIEWVAGDITIETADVDEIQVSESKPSAPKYAMVWKQNNDKLSIRFCESQPLDFGFGITLNEVISKDLTILVPMGWECESLEVDAASATLEVKDLVMEEVDFDGASGICKFENCSIKELELDTASGDIYFTGSLDVMDCDAASASVIAVFDNAPSRISMDSMSGDLDITLHENVGFTVSMDALSSDFVCDFGYAQKRDGTYSRGDGKCRINLDALSGDLYIRECKTAAASGTFDTHHHTDSCTTDPDSCPDNSTHHTEPHHN